MSSKTGSYDALREVLTDSLTRSGRKCKFLKSDGDGVFGRSGEFQKIQKDFGFVHERPAPYDHDQNSFIDRECRSLLEGVSTSLFQSGAPSSFWGEAAAHYTFTRNKIPRHEREEGGVKILLSADEVFEGVRNPFSLRRLVAFGTQVTCYIPPKRREEGKGPSQKRAFDGVLLGYVDDMRAYRVWV